MATGARCRRSLRHIRCHCEATPHQIVVTARVRARHWAGMVMDTAVLVASRRLLFWFAGPFNGVVSWLADGIVRPGTVWQHNAAIKNAIELAPSEFAGQ